MDSLDESALKVVRCHVCDRAINVEHLSRVYWTSSRGSEVGGIVMCRRCVYELVQREEQYVDKYQYTFRSF